MSVFVFANNASTLIASAITPSSTTVVAAAGQGALFPSIAAGQVAACTLEDVNGNIEIVYATGRTGDTLTIARAQEGTTALAFASGSSLEQRITEAVLATFLQKQGGDTLSGTTTLSGVLALGGGGSIQGGELAGTPIRSSPGDTSNQILVPAGGGPATEGGSVMLTSANLAAHMPAGTALVLTNMIVMWAGLSSAIPSGWALCNGTSGTPDLRDQFIVGGGGSLAVTGSFSHVTDAASAGTPAFAPLTLAAANLPTHQHPFDYAAGNGSVNYIGIPGFTLPNDYIFNGTGVGGRNSFAGAIQSGTTGQPFTPTGSPMGAHTHTVESPPYHAVFFIMKL
jgi:hypothetical protein